MDTNQETAPFLFVAGQRCLDFVNTEMVDRRGQRDLIPDYAALLSWLQAAGLLNEAEVLHASEAWAGPTGEKIHAKAVALRGTLREMAEGLADGRAIAPTTLALLNTLLQARRGYAEIAVAGAGYERRFRAPLTEPGHLIAVLAEATADLLCCGDVSRVKQCKNPDCILFFYDTSKNHARSWCSMSLCGARMKVAAYRRRTRSTQ